MMDLLNFSTSVYNAIYKFLIWFLGDFNKQFYALLIFVIVDFILGILCALIKKRFSWKALKYGIIKKTSIFIAIGLTNIIDINLINDEAIIRTTVLIFYASYEAFSVTNHLSEIGLPIPKCLVDLLKHLHNNSNDNSDSNTN